MSIASTLVVVILGLIYLVTGYEPHAFLRVRDDNFSDLIKLSLSRNDKVIPRREFCNGVKGGYQCFTNISHHWGAYSPYFSLAEEGINGAIPNECDVTFVQALSRHGARYPTASKSKKYKKLLEAIQANATAYKDKTQFLRSYNYSLGSDDLIPFGEREMVNSGIKFYNRYKALTRDYIPFIRSSGSSRVIESGEFFIQGFNQSKTQDNAAKKNQSSPTINVVISEDTGMNNTLNHNTCPAFEASELGDNISDNYTAIFAPGIKSRLESSLPGVTLSNKEVVYLMDMCPFDTLSKTADGKVQSPFCALFTDAEWIQYDYLQSLSKYYGFGAGNQLGPTQGVGFVNELIARLTHTAVHDDTSTNHTLDAPNAPTFPLSRSLYIDFTHDNGMIPIFSALGLYNGTVPLQPNHAASVGVEDGFSAAWTVPFAARAYVEVMQCRGKSKPDPLVRVLVNDRVVPLHGCTIDSLGRCRLDEFVRALDFAKTGGDWNACYT
ncbi:Histidine phosphatase superfamily clade-2 [Penicillium taxi]|uniref:Histidine phosphatase superfamily clade-2 n=1 Tax=Penicillium taxi TaxID=168475 RepID=UPI0025452EBC|nr:Histidine phosphatase superfamily clade-2 [Penicillium taxi]KAJ5895151.1 Histidine phosphatase superfamily clade-2 [Penicillium taxi]